MDMHNDMDVQRRFWNEYDSAHREQSSDVPIASRRQSEIIRGWLGSISQRSRILEVGCAGGWFSEQLAAFGQVTATDLADEVIARAKLRAPHIEFLAGDFDAIDFGPHRFDVAV